MHKSICALAALILFGWSNLYAEAGSCHLDISAEDNGLLSLNGKPLGPAIIFGTDVEIPSFRLRFEDSRTGSVLKPSQVRIAYGWTWLQYPYPEHSWGAWSDASDIVACVESEDVGIVVPAFKVKPRGWYDGKYTKFPFYRKPSFSGIDVTAVLPECSTRVSIKPRETAALAGKTAVVRVACHGESTVSYKKQ